MTSALLGVQKLREKEYLGTVQSCKLNAEYAAVRFEGRVCLHMVSTDFICLSQWNINRICSVVSLLWVAHGLESNPEQRWLAKHCGNDNAPEGNQASDDDDDDDDVVLFLF